MTMDLRRQLESQRVRRSRKRPLDRSLFDRVSTIVRTYGLDDRFLDGLGRSDDPGALEMVRDRVPEIVGHAVSETVSNATPDMERAAVPVTVRDAGSETGFARVPESSKPVLQVPLFALATEDEYHLSVAIMERADNPYLAYANSPEEIVLSGLLYRYRPALDPEVLASRHFAALLAGAATEEDAGPEAGSDVVPPGERPRPDAGE